MKNFETKRNKKYKKEASVPFLLFLPTVKLKQAVAQIKNKVDFIW